jgi:hypothetical protein
MAGYQRKTALGPEDILSEAEALLPERLGVARTKQSAHGATYTGAEGTVVISAHPHGAYTVVVADTDRLRTSRMDLEVQRFLNQLPYEPGDAGGPGSGDPT